MFKYIFHFLSLLSSLGIEEEDTEHQRETKARITYGASFLLIAVFIFHIISFEKSYFSAFASIIYATYFFTISTLILQGFKLWQIAFYFYFVTGTLILFVFAAFWGGESMVQLFMMGICLELILHYRDNFKIGIIAVAFVVMLFLLVSLVNFAPLFVYLGIKQEVLAPDMLFYLRRYVSIVSVLFVINVSLGFVRKIHEKNQTLNQKLAQLESINAELEESRKMQKAVFDNSFDSQVLFEEKNNVFIPIDCNEQSLVTFECTDKKMYLDNISFFRCDPNADKNYQIMIETLKNSDYYSDEMIFQTYTQRKFLAKRWIKKIHLDGKNYLLGGIEDVSEAREAANKIIESEARLVSVFNSTTDRVWSVNLDLEMQYFNTAFQKAYKEYWGKEPQIGIHALSVFQNLHISRKTKNAINWKMEFEEVLKGKRKTFEVSVAYPNKTIYLSHTLNPIIEPETGEVIGCTAWSKDITDITLKMIEIEEKNQLISLILGTIPDMLYIYDIQENRGIYSNKNQADLLGYDEEEINTPNFIIDNMIYPDDKQMVIAHWERIKSLKDDEVTLIEHRAFHKDGTVKWFASREKVFMRDEQGNVKQYIGLTQDVSEWKKAQANILRNEHQLEMAQEIGKFGSFVYEMKSGDFKTTKQLNALLDLEENASFDDYFNRIHNKDKKKYRLAVGKLLRYGETINLTVRFVRKNDEIGYFKVRAIAVQNKKNEIEQIIGTLQDVTEHKRIESELMKQNDALEKLNNELDTFVYSTAHDLRGPVSSALGLIQLIHNKHNSAETTTYVELQQKCLEKMDSFICNIILFSYNSRLPIKNVEIDFHKLIGEALFNLKYNENEDKVNVEISIHTKCPFVSDLSRLEIILQHLLSNAFRFADLTKENPYIKVEVKCQSKQMHITVADNGIGIEESFLPKVFDMLCKGTVKSAGSGIGLYIVKDFVLKLGGTVDIKSELKQGTTVTIVLPNEE